MCRLLAVLNEDERDLILDLCERYEWVSYADYGALIVKIFEDLKVGMDQMPKKIYLAPIKKIADEDKYKSGDSLIYLLSGFMHVLPLPFNRLNYEQIKSSQLKSQDIVVSEDEMIFFIDDFLGSGDTFKSMYHEISNNITISPSKIKVLSLVAHQEGVNMLNEMGIDSSIAIVQQRGISDHYCDPIKTKKIEVMKKIETCITKNKKLQFGYNQSEGLVTLIRTPNNTFPFFWMEYKGKGTLEPPFPRFQFEKS